MSTTNNNAGGGRRRRETTIKRRRTRHNRFPATQRAPLTKKKASGIRASAEATSKTVLSDLLPKSVSPSTKTQSMNQTATPASMSRPIQVIGARLLINSESGNFDLLGLDILLLISHRDTADTETKRQKQKDQ